MNCRGSRTPWIAFRTVPWTKACSRRSLLPPADSKKRNHGLCRSPCSAENASQSEKALVRVGVFLRVLAHCVGRPTYLSITQKCAGWHAAVARGARACSFFVSPYVNRLSPLHPLPENFGGLRLGLEYGVYDLSSNP